MPSIRVSAIVNRSSYRARMNSLLLPSRSMHRAFPRAVAATATAAPTPALRYFSSGFHATNSFYKASSQSSALTDKSHSRLSSSDAASPSPTPPFRKILIANRGEIAIRILETARAHNIKTVAIYSTADAHSPHVTLADEAVCIGPPASNQSYLDMDKVCQAVEMTGSEGVHPGYGFLSENSNFAERVEGMLVNQLPHNDGGRLGSAEGRKQVKFIGPSTHAIQSLGDKIQSKLLADAAGVSTIPGYNGVVTSPDHALEIAHEIGYPVMIKASSGGGGKGMRICYNDDQVIEGFRLGSAEAKSFFGDDRLLVEKYVEDPHHIEIQVLSGKNPATGELDILCFPERECSIQRRNQKVIEESPSPHLLPSTRREMIRQVKSLVRQVGYESAGTVEFLVDKHQHFFFLEMNTRLQVEHPVTEMISGDGYASGNYVDLVHGMLEVAAGRGIPQKYLDMIDTSNVEEDAKDGGEGANVRYTGHAIEARVYAEDPLRGFLPSTGPLVKYVEPPSLLNVDGSGSGEDGPCHIRIDTGVLPGAIITPHYDPILSKVISYSPTSRNHAILGLGSALDQYLLRGVQHNVPFVRDVLRNEDFVKGYTPTGFIGEHYPDGFSGGQLSEKERRELVVIAREIQRRRELVMDNPPLAMSGRSGDRDGEALEEEVVVCLGGMFGDAYLVRSSVDFSDGSGVTSSVTKVSATVEDEVEVVNLSALEYEPSNDLAHVKIAGESRALQVHGDDEIGMLKLTMYGSNADILVMSPAEYQLACHMEEPIPVDLGDFVLSPMPGTLISFAVKEGDVVEMDQELCVLEAMKMQNVIRSHKAGATVGKLHGEVGASLRADEILLEFEKLESVSS
eukprot:CAMPEP_0201870296 /NCGR_PEP_ID=MMETSP0902-20130614/3447_1 /ASSEMBLY_ACC=CAM_ASM_000551 /TAXON_ID=420261 /ORGANISM="Thalassiosira antarctica, Strain CCMP982" /LENGTH=850 /DNA_ID=CAMNT_0048395887 /DNA_START=152 /DNA_END=2704 /DNA_ORIENTATION=-